MDFDFQRQCEEAFVNPAGLLDGLLRVSQIVRLRFNDWLGRFELTEGRYSVLVALASEEDGGCSQARLAERLGQSGSNISTLIERMQRDGLVSRSKSDADRRKRILQITPAGRLVLNSVNTQRSAWASRLLAGVRSHEQAKLFELLKSLGGNLEDSFEIPWIVPAPFVQESESAHCQLIDPTEDPKSPQFALRQMLQSLSSSSAIESRKKDVA